MEGSGEGGDDQGSGWLQVKKKHRSISKFSLQGWVGGLSGKQASNVLRSQPSSSVKVGTSDGKYSGQPLKARGDFALHGRGFVANSTPVSNEDEKGVHYLDKCVVSQDNELLKLPSLKVENITKSDNTTGDIGELPQYDKPKVLQKIKWGNLEDDGSLALHCESTVSAEIKVGDNRNDNLVFREAENANISVACIHSRTDTKGDKLVSTSVDTSHVLHRTHPLSPGTESFEENCKEVNEVSPEDPSVETADEKRVNLNDDVSSCHETHQDCVNLVKNDLSDASSLSGDKIVCAPTEEPGMMVELAAAAVICETGDPEISEVPVVKGGSCTEFKCLDSESLLPKKSGLEPEAPGKSAVITSVEDCGGQQAAAGLDLTRAPIMNAVGAADEGESKERFRQRLWCFLFENLNRAVDELYLLCELECDIEQMKEAILVLEEAASDFKELNSRVEAFENVKKSSSHLVDEAAVTMKSDHRRPHALSWEVRRMTTSPRRAEILSSSLEAFRKIQQERASRHMAGDIERQGLDCSDCCHASSDIVKRYGDRSEAISNAKESVMKSKKQSGVLNLTQGQLSGEKTNADSGRSSKINSGQNDHHLSQNPSTSATDASKLPTKESCPASVIGKSKREQLGSVSEMEKLLPKKEKILTETMVDKNPRSVDHIRKQVPLPERDKERRNGMSWKSMDAWKEKRNWEDIFASPFRVSSRFSHSPGLSRRSAERARILRDKLMSPEKKKKTALDLKKEAEEKHARAMKIRSELENERVQKLQRTSEKLSRVNEWQAVRSMKLREGMYARHQRSESRHEAFLAQVVRRAGDESSKVNEVRFITSLNEENKKLILRQKLHDSELRRAEKLQVMKSKQKEDMAREEAVLERRKLIEAEKLQRIVETQRKKEEAQVRREEERKASSAAREAKAIEQLRRKEVRARAQQEEAELLAQKLAEKLRESEQRRKFYLEQIRERASMDFRDQSSPLLRRSLNKDGQGRSTSTNNGEEYQVNSSGQEGSTILTGNLALQHSLKRRIKRIRQRLMALKFEFLEPPFLSENAGIGYRTAVGTARVKIGKWLQELQRLRQARKDGAASIGLITAEMIKFLEGKDPELRASRQAGLLDFIASALPASHASRPESCQVTIYLLRLLRVVLSVPANRSYFLAQNLLPPVIPMLAAALENYIKIAASSNVPGSSNMLSSKTSFDNLESISEVLDGFLWTVVTVMGHASSDERQIQMQDGLQELVIAYQVIHRLRDLFALYDRPQVEGSPFPSSILLSINLLAVLTSRSRTIFSIDWDSFPFETVPGNKDLEAKLGEAAGFESACLYNSNGDNRSLVYAINGSQAVPLPDVPEDRPLGDSNIVKKKDGLVNIDKDTDKVELIINKADATAIPDESHGNLRDDTAESSISQKNEKCFIDNTDQRNENKLGLKQSVAFLLSAISETGLICLPSLLTAVLLQANNKVSAEQASYVLPSNFEEVATGVLKVLNNLALVDITFMQRMLARPDLKMEFFHLMSFLLSHCTSKWRVAHDQIGLLLFESLLLLGYFSLFHPENQAVLRWGKSPTILHKVCDLPFVFFSDPELMPFLAGTLVAACFGCEQNKGVVQQELSTDMLLSLIRSCRSCLPASQSNSTLDSTVADYSSELREWNTESKKLQGDMSLRSSRYSSRNPKISSGKGGALGNNARASKMRNQRDSKTAKLSEEMPPKQNLTAPVVTTTLTLHSKFSGTFIDRAEQFFSAEITSSNDGH